MKQRHKRIAWIALGVVNLPIIYFSVQWWNTLHQGSTVKFTGSSMHVAMFTGMILMALAFWMYSIAVAMVRVRCEIVEDETPRRFAPSPSL